MINKKFINSLRENYIKRNSERRQIISLSNIILNNSKKSIFAIHRQDLKLASDNLKESEKIIEKLKKNFGLNRVKEEGSYSAAMEEYVEAKLFYQLIKTGKIEKIQKIDTSETAYIGGICDLSGELVRKATHEAICKNYGEVKRIRDIINEILSELIDFDIIGHMRTKYDQARNNLKKIEQMDYEISLREDLNKK
jgi:predicted translin family RNA/ssDNA-binding protein